MDKVASSFDVARRYLHGEITVNQPTEWLASRLGSIVEESATNEGAFATRAHHLCLLVESGEIGEDELREQLVEMLVLVSSG